MWKEDASSSGVTSLLVIVALACGYVSCPLTKLMIPYLTKLDEVDRQSVALEKAILKGQLQRSSLPTRHNDILNAEM